MFGHGRQLWGLAVHPDDELFATAGHDKNIALWRKHKLIWACQVLLPVCNYQFKKNKSYVYASGFHKEEFLYIYFVIYKC